MCPWALQTGGHGPGSFGVGGGVTSPVSWGGAGPFLWVIKMSGGTSVLRV